MTLPPYLIAIGRLRRLADALESGKMPAAADGVWLADRLRQYLVEAPRGGSFELILGLSPTGGITWWQAERLIERDCILCEIAGRHFADDDRPAESLAAAYRRYDRAARAIDLERGESDAPAGSLRADLFRLAIVGGPPGARRLADILRAAA